MKHDLKKILEEIEREYIAEALEECNGNHTHTAEYLGLTRTCLVMKLKKYGFKVNPAPGARK